MAMLVPLVLIAGLVIALDEGKEELGRDVIADQNRQQADGSAASGGSDREATTSAKPHLVRIGTFDQPLYVTAPPGDRRRIFVVEQPGRIRVIVGGKVKARPFLDISGRVTSGGEQGLLSMAFAPDYRTSGRFYVYFNDRNGEHSGAGVPPVAQQPEPCQRLLGPPDPVLAPAVLESQRRDVAVRPRRPSLCGDGRRRGRRRS